jgi:hypothetical protein
MKTERKFHTEHLHIFHATIQNSVTMGFVNSWPGGLVSVQMVLYIIAERYDIKSNLQGASSFVNE